MHSGVATQAERGQGAEGPGGSGLSGRRGERRTFSGCPSSQCHVVKAAGFVFKFTTHHTLVSMILLLSPVERLNWRPRHT